jgi:hypothetical protein
VDAPGRVSAEEVRKVRCDGITRPPTTPVERDTLKLIIFNIHGTLLGCSLLKEKNLSPIVRTTLNTTTLRRVVLRPWLLEFLTRYFKNFVVGFWGSKSKSYMQEIAPTILGRLKAGTGSSLSFVWSGQQSEAIEFDDGVPIAWGKPL